jgi:hypothetical protein
MLMNVHNELKYMFKEYVQTYCIRIFSVRSSGVRACWVILMQLFIQLKSLLHPSVIRGDTLDFSDNRNFISF